MGRHFLHALWTAAIVVASVGGTAATPAPASAPAAASAPSVFLAQTTTGARALTARDLERQRAEEDRKRLRDQQRRRMAQNRPSRGGGLDAPPPARKPAAIAAGSGIRLSAALTAGGAAVEENVVWTIEPMDGAAEAIVTGEPTPLLALEAGRYRVTAKLGDFLSTAEVDVAGDRIEPVELSFRAARLRVSVLPSENAMPLEDARIRVVRIAASESDVVFDAVAPDFDQIMQAGIYRIEASHGLARTGEDIGLTAGADREVVLNLSVGYVRVRAQPSPGQEPLANAVFELLPADGLDPAARPLATVSGPQAVFTLPSGPYRIVARYGEATARQTVDVAANSFSDLMIDLEAGRAVFDLAGQPGQGPRQATFRLSGHGESGGSSLLLTRTGERMDLGLPSGSYTIEAEWAGEVVRQDFLLEPGAKQKITLAFRPGRLTLQASLAGGDELPGGDVAWSVAAEGEPDAVAADTSGGPLQLPAGSYEVTARHAGTGAEARTIVSLDPGSDVTARLEFALGTADLRARGEQGGLWLVSRPDGSEVAREEGSTARLLLDPGDYVVTLTVGETRHTAALNISQGGTTTVTLPAL